MRYLSQNAAKKVTYAELSENFHYHKNTINRLVKEAAGVTPKEYAIRQKIKEAQKFLCFTDMSAEEISQALGYSSPVFQPAIQAENGFHARAVPKPQQNAVKKFHGVLQ